MTVLILTDNFRGRWIGRLRGTGAAARIAPLGIEPAVLAEKIPCGSWDVIDLADPAAEAQSLVRTFLPWCMHTLPRQPLGGTTLFKLFASSPINLWWFLEVTEKSPLRGHLADRLYNVAVARAALIRERPDEIWLDLEDSLLAGILARWIQSLGVRAIARTRTGWHPLRVTRPVLRYVWYALGTWALHVARVLAVRLLRGCPEPPEANGITFFSFFPAWWNDPYGPRPQEWFVQELPDAVRVRTSVAFALWLSAGPVRYWWHADRRRTLQGVHAAFLQDLLGIRAAAEVLALRHLRRMIQARRLTRQIRLEFAGIEVGPLIQDEIERSMTAPEFFLDLLLASAISRYVERYRPRALVYRLEFQPFEKAILAGTAGRVRTVAFQHSTFGANYLPYHFVPGELNRCGDGATIPLPDVVLTTGAYARDTMIAGGFPPEDVRVVGAVRYRHLLERVRHPLPVAQLRAALNLPRDRPVAVVATSVVRGQSLALLSALRQALRSLPEPPFVAFKPHPAMAMKAEFRSLLVPALAGDGYTVLAANASLHDYLAASDVVVLTGTTVGVEAMLLGVMPIIFEGRAVFDAKSMRDLADVCLFAANAKELTGALRMVLEEDPHIDALRARWPEAIERMFDRLDVDPYERFVAVLREYGLAP